jgi:hypothetical protein
VKGEYSNFNKNKKGLFNKFNVFNKMSKLCVLNVI